jgi:hypothetical protein
VYSCNHLFDDTGQSNEPVQCQPHMTDRIRPMPIRIRLRHRRRSGAKRRTAGITISLKTRTYPMSRHPAGIGILMDVLRWVDGGYRRYARSGKQGILVE